MIHPSYDKNLKYRPSQRSFILYYCVAFLLCLTNFIPVLVGTPLASTAKVAQNTEKFLNVCYLLSIPLLFEFTLDTIAAQFQALSVLKELEHRFGHGLLLVSLFLVVFLVSGNLVDHISAFVVNCVFAMLQTLVITGMFGKLQAHGNGHWSMRGCWSIILFYVLSEVSTRFGMIYHSHSELSFTICVSFSLAYLVVCFCIHWYLRKKFLAHYLGIKIGSSVPSGPAGIDDIVCFILQGIITIYLLVSICVLCVFLVSGYHLETYTNIEILKQLALALCAAILPGRMIRRSFILLRHEMDTKESFIRYISHEIRSPLSTTSLGLDYLIERMTSSCNSTSEYRAAPSDAASSSLSMREALSIVMETKVTCELAMNTLNDFLMLDKIQSNMLQISTAQCAAGELMMNTVRAFRLQAETNEVMLKCSSQVIDGTDILSLPSVSLQVDQYKTNQVFRNLLTNALKFTGSGGCIEVTMTLRSTSSGEELEALSDLSTSSPGGGKGCMVRYAVKDSGCGISKENLPRLFGQYVQFDADKLQGGKGSGLGLWLSKAIVEMHGGRIGATSEGEGKGSTFWFELPCEVTLPHNRSGKGGAASAATVRESVSGEVDLEAGTAGGREEADCHDVTPFSLGPTSPQAAAAAAGGGTSLFDKIKSEALPEEVLKVFDLERQHSNSSKHTGAAAGAFGSSQASVAAASRPNSAAVHLMKNEASTGTVTSSPSVVSRLLMRQPTYSPAALSRKNTAAPSLLSSHPLGPSRSHTYSHLHEEPKHPCADHSSGPSSKAPTASAASGSGRDRGLRVLLVDDSSIARKMVERSLSKTGAVCWHAANGREAVDRVRESLQDTTEGAVKYDVILMDYQMPEMSGPAAIVAIRALGYRGVIVAVSGMSSEESEFTALLRTNQIDGVMLKPFDLEMFQGIMNDVKL